MPMAPSEVPWERERSEWHVATAVVMCSCHDAAYRIRWRTDAFCSLRGGARRGAKQGVAGTSEPRHPGRIEGEKGERGEERGELREERGELREERGEGRGELREERREGRGELREERREGRGELREER
jgi:hypothetical protein